MTGIRIKSNNVTKASIIKRSKTVKEKKNKLADEKQKLVKQIEENTKDMLLPTLQEKSKELSDKIVSILNEKGKDKVNNTQILSMIARKSISELAMSMSRVSYTPQEIIIGFNLYLDMITKINDIKQFPATPESFSLFMGVSYDTYKMWLVDQDKKQVMDYINSYMLGTLSSGGLTGELREISAMYQQKVLGKVEQTTPVIIEHKKTTDIDDINKQLNALKRDNVIKDAEYEEVEKDE